MFVKHVKVYQTPQDDRPKTTQHVYMDSVRFELDLPDDYFVVGEFIADAEGKQLLEEMRQEYEDAEQRARAIKVAIEERHKLILEGLGAGRI